MGGGESTFKTVVLEDGMSAVVRTDPAKPRLLEVIGIFYDQARALRYADFENGQLAGASGEQPAPPQVQLSKARDRIIEKSGAPELTDRQNAVLEALRARAGGGSRIEIKGADLAEAANIPLGSIHSVILSLEKKKKIATTRPGSSHAPPVYEIL